MKQPFPNKQADASQVVSNESVRPCCFVVSDVIGSSQGGRVAMGDDAHDLCSTNLSDDLRHYLDECSARSGGAASYSHFHTDS